METGVEWIAKVFSLDLIPILPMRHGNLASSSSLSRNRHYSDPTYEAWKLHSQNNQCNQDDNSDPTYEAWKQVRSICNCPISLRFRSYLWGMETLGSYCNRIFQTIFRSYLWGMETRQVSLYHTPNTPHSDPTYEAWKHTWERCPQCCCPDSDPTYEAWKPVRFYSDKGDLTRFRSYLWGMETKGT